MWPDSRFVDLVGVELPLVQAPMAGLAFADMVVAVCEAGGLGSLACALLSPAQIRAELELIRRGTARPIHLNFFCHETKAPDAEREQRWQARLATYYGEFGVTHAQTVEGGRAPFDDASCGLVEEFAPEVVSFHFGLPKRELLARVKATGAKVLASATTVAEARWLASEGCDAIIAQGHEAGGHRGMFLSDDSSRQVGTLALVPQVVDAVQVPVIAAGGIADARGIAAAFALGASAVQIGTAYLFCPEARLNEPHRAALRRAADDDTVVTNVFTGRPARGIANRIVRELGPLSELAPAFPRAGAAVAPLRAAAEQRGSIEFSPLWAGQAAPLGRELGAYALTRALADEARERLARLATARA